MPTNLPPDYFEVEERYRAASTTQEKIACLEEMLSIIPKHKGTDKLRADLRRKLSKLKSSSQARRRPSKRESAFLIDREGAGQAVLVGPPNVGKSSLVVALTNATPEVADFPYTTWKPTPGMMTMENVQIQLIDTPPLNREFVDPQLLALIRRADLVLLVVDLQRDPFSQLEETVALLEEHRIVPLQRRDQIIEPRGISFKPFLVLVNKSDDEESDEDFEIFRALLDEEWTMLPISAHTGRNLDQMKRSVFDQLQIVRIYSKAPGQEPNYSQPIIMDKGSTVEDFAGEIHQDFLEKLSMARIWGHGVYEGQLVGRDHILHDEDVVQLHM